MLFLDGVYVIDETGQKLFTLQTVPARLQGLGGNANGVATSGGFSLHAGIDIAPGQRARLERLCRYVSRPPVATERLAMTSSGLVATVRPVTRIGRCRRGALHVLSAIGPNPVGVPINLFKANRWVTGDQLL